MLNWSKAEVDFVIKNAAFVDDDEGTRQFNMLFSKNISVNTWRRLRVKLGLRKATGVAGGASIIPGSPLDQAGYRIEDLTSVKV